MKTFYLLGTCVLLYTSGFSQNVGIGITDPVFKLDVRDGSINVDSVYRIGAITVLATPGTGNLFMGKDAGKINTGAHNTFSGELAGFNNNSGSSNSIFGQTGGYENNTGDGNSFFGRSAGYYNSSGNYNSFFGRSSAYANTTGDYNTAFGSSSLTNNTIGTLNTALGYNANLNNIGTLNNATAIGANARVDCSNCLVLGSVNAINGASSGVNVGIGITEPTEKLHVSGNIKAGIIMPDGIMLTPNAGEGKILTSDAQGNASWEESNAGGGVGYGSWGDCSTNGISEYLAVADDNGNTSDNFGISVSISGNYAIVGAPHDSAGIIANQGSASTFQNNNGNWTLMEEITDATGAPGQSFGTGVSISGNYAIVGAYFENTGAGTASIYQYSGGSWNLMQKLTDATGSGSENFGYSVSISGNYVIVGAPSDDVPNLNQGSVSIFEYTNGNWELMEKITDAAGGIGDQFGLSVSISGNYAVVGAVFDDDVSGANQGSASIYQYINGSWQLMEKILDATGALDDNFGYSVSISGTVAIVGSPLDNVGTNTDQGSASIYKLNGMDWMLMQKITDPGGGVVDWFGFSVFMSGIYAIVGAPSDFAPSGTRGSATIYYRVGPGWQKLQYISDPAGTSSDFFGHSVAIDGVTKRFLIGANGYLTHSGKALFGKIN